MGIKLIHIRSAIYRHLIMLVACVGCVLVVCLCSYGGDNSLLDHRIMPGDRLRITIMEEPEGNKVYAVAGDGAIDFPMIGRVRIVDLTIREAAELIEKQLEKDFFRDATVTVQVSEFVEGAILVVGEVNRPATIPFSGDQILTLVEVITQCGGLTDNAAGDAVRILRWKMGAGMERQIVTVDVQSMFDDLNFSGDQFLRPRDIILVPSVGEAGGNRREILALGEVGNPGFHPYSDGMDMIRAITRIGGVTHAAKMNAVRILRSDGKGGYTAIPVDLSRLLGGADMRMNIAIEPGDIIFAPSSAQATHGQIYLLGAVARPGAIPLSMDHDMTLARTILATGGFSEYANEGKVKIIRTAPDGSKQTLVINVGKILKTGAFEDDVPLQNGDVVIVPEKVFF